MTSTPNLRTATVAWLSAILDSAHVDVIGVTNWWPRATAALETAATSATYGEAVTIACRKLQIDTLLTKSSEQLVALEDTIGPRLGDWQQIVAAEAPYLIALTKITRKTRKETKK
ncbi:hypothetical protein [Brevibacterium otitidis]|uniref:Uncharacterized protein n=1 Tax=Brevibacterium otitidis TaxID=53364 RepID=A0ABV5X133_9MICO|nr:hypothetical protein GCM10023233_04600 [Brevibacterium otitidis]